MNENSSVFIAYLRFEANMAADRARQLREMADRLEADIKKPGVEVGKYRTVPYRTGNKMRHFSPLKLSVTYCTVSYALWYIHRTVMY